MEAAFITLVRDRADAIFVAPTEFFVSRRVQFATLATRHGIPAAYAVREHVEAGGLMSYGTDVLDMYQVGIYAGQILKAKPADLPVLRPPNSSSSLTCKQPGRSTSVPTRSKLLADEVIE